MSNLEKWLISIELEKVIKDIRDFNLYQYQKEAAKWQRQKEKLRPRQR